MDERPEGVAHQPQPGVQQPDGEADPEHIPRKAEDERSSSQPPCSGGKGDPVGGTAHHTIQDDDVGRLDVVGSLENVDDPKRRPPFEALLPGKLARKGLVRGHELHDLTLLRTCFEELGLDPPDAAPDLEHPRGSPRVRRDVRDQVALELVEPLLLIRLETAAREARLEEPLTRLRTTAALHRATTASALRAPARGRARTS